MSGRARAFQMSATARASRSSAFQRVGGVASPGLAARRVQPLDAYLDKPWGWFADHCADA